MDRTGFGVPNAADGEHQSIASLALPSLRWVRLLFSACIQRSQTAVLYGDSEASCRRYQSTGGSRVARARITSSVPITTRVEVARYTNLTLTEASASR